MKIDDKIKKDLEEIIIDQEIDYLARILVEAFIKKKMKENPNIKDPRPLMEIRKLVEDSKMRRKLANKKQPF